MFQAHVILLQKKKSKLLCCWILLYGIARAFLQAQKVSSASWAIGWAVGYTNDLNLIAWLHTHRVTDQTTGPLGFFFFLKSSEPLG